MLSFTVSNRIIVERDLYWPISLNHSVHWTKFFIKQFWHSSKPQKACRFIKTMLIQTTKPNCLCESPQKCVQWTALHLCVSCVLACALEIDATARCLGETSLIRINYRAVQLIKNKCERKENRGVNWEHRGPENWEHITLIVKYC